ncbi:hypothetical protein FGO68_gene8202 [Halteria grandinella]|uniref:Uncharacterized protein n=1 Tax=Halteria grandinella TaxID=5974 RepID=A0A8J8T6T8_HALGN|nr:hypothetical protein FGO68_gene8202 [Halteria grandinella]
MIVFDSGIFQTSVQQLLYKPSIINIQYCSDEFFSPLLQVCLQFSEVILLRPACVLHPPEKSSSRFQLQPQLSPAHPLPNYLTLSIYSLRSMSTSHSMALVSANTRLALMNMSLSDSLMQLLMNELAVEETDEETLIDATSRSAYLNE